MKRFTADQFSDDFFRVAQSDAYRKKILKDLENHSKPRPDVFLDTVFKPGFSEQFKTEMRRLLQTLLHFSIDIGLCVDVTKIQVVFMSVTLWQMDKKRNESVPANLPCLKVIHYQREERFVIIVADRRQTSADMMNITRLLFSKIFGEHFFTNNIVRKPPFAELLKRSSLSFHSVPLKIAIGRLYFEQDERLLRIFQTIGNASKLHGENAIKLGRNHFFRAIDDETGEGIAYGQMLDKIIDDFLKGPLAFFKKRHEHPLSKIYQNNKVHYLILPNEVYSFRSLEKKPAVMFNLISERAQYLLSVSEQLEAICGTAASFSDHSNSGSDPKKQPRFSNAEVNNSEIQPEPADNGSNEEIRQEPVSEVYLLNIIRDGLLSRGLAKSFLLPEAVLKEPKLIIKKRLFLLRIIREFSEFEGKQIEKNTAEKILKNYTNCLSQRLYNICQLKLIELADSRNGRQNQHTASLIKVNLNWIKFRRQYIEDFSQLAHFFGELFKASDPFVTKLSEKLSSARAGWAYFISSVLLYLYYDLFLEEKTEGQNKKERFIRIIREHIAANMSTKTYFRYANLFMKLFEKADHDLKKIITILSRQSPPFTAVIRDGIIQQHVPSDEYLAIVSESILNWLALFEETEAIQQRRLSKLI